MPPPCSSRPTPPPAPNGSPLRRALPLPPHTTNGSRHAFGATSSPTHGGSRHPCARPPSPAARTSPPKKPRSRPGARLFSRPSCPAIPRSTTLPHCPHLAAPAFRALVLSHRTRLTDPAVHFGRPFLSALDRPLPYTRATSFQPPYPTACPALLSRRPHTAAPAIHVSGRPLPPPAHDGSRSIPDLFRRLPGHPLPLPTHSGSRHPCARPDPPPAPIPQKSRAPLRERGFFLAPLATANGS